MGAGLCDESSLLEGESDDAVAIVNSRRLK